MAKKIVNFENLSELEFVTEKITDVKTEERILILSLGTGKVNEDGSANYKKAQYSISGKAYEKNGIQTKTSFVAEPLMNEFKPDRIVVLGTVRSAWYSFFSTMITENDEDRSYVENGDYKRLVQINKEYGIKTDGDSLKDLGKEITNIFKRMTEWKRLGLKENDAKPMIHILLTKYGIDQEELRENYAILKRIEGFMSKDVNYEVAFDMTHSFRSLPIYNLIILNYIKNITEYKIKITHVYYGNLEASHECGEIAPIVDLAELVDVMNRTNGVSEFKDTGNSVALIKMIDDGELKRELELFDLATQLNAFGAIGEELVKLCKISSESSDEDRYTGIRKMINLVLSERFFNDDKITPNKIANMSILELKFHLAQWYFNQNRMGLGLATGLEALRDLNTPIFVMRFNDSAADARMFREQAETHFINIAEKIAKKESKTELEEVFSRLGTKLRKYKAYRNMFAHSLSNEDASDMELIRQEVNEFKENLFRLKNCYDLYTDEYKRLFSNTKKSSKMKSNACRVILNCDGTQECNYDRYKTSQNNNYDVFYLNNDVQTELLGSKQHDYTAEQAFFLYQYLKKNMPADYENIHLIIHNCNEKEKEFLLKITIEQLVNEDHRSQYFEYSDYSQKHSHNVGLILSMEELQDKYGRANKKYSKLMGKEMLQA